MPHKLLALAFSLPLTTLLLGACASTPTVTEGETRPTGQTRCNAAPAQFAIGRPADAALQTDARSRTGAKTVRVLRPDQVVTMEFNAERLNLSVDAAGRINRVNCG